MRSVSPPLSRWKLTWLGPFLGSPSAMHTTHPSGSIKLKGLTENLVAPRMEGSSVSRSALNSTGCELVLYNSNQSLPLVDCAIHSLMRRLAVAPRMAGAMLAAPMVGADSNRHR